MEASHPLKTPLSTCQSKCHIPEHPNLQHSRFISHFVLYTISLHHLSTPSLYTISLYHLSTPSLYTISLHHLSIPSLYTISLHHLSTPSLYTISLHHLSDNVFHSLHCQSLISSNSTFFLSRERILIHTPVFLMFPPMRHLGDGVGLRDISC